MKLVLHLAALFLATPCFAQHQNVYFLKNNGKYVGGRDSADYVRVVSMPDTGSALFNITDYYLNGKPKLIGKSTKVYPPWFEGQCVTYYKNGNKESITNYKNDALFGTEFDFYTNGKVYLVKEYLNNNKYNNTTSNFLIKANYDSLGTATVDGGNGYCKLYDDDFKAINEEGSVKNAKRDGQWKGYFKNRGTTFTENYKDGSLIDGTAVTKDGISTVYTKTRGTPPKFKGGLEAFGTYLSNRIQYPEDERRRGIEGKVIISFVVEQDGKVSEVKVSKTVSPGIDDEAVRVIKYSPRWVPGTLFGRPTRAIYSVPVSFTLN